jgi:hypothetical protein
MMPAPEGPPAAAAAPAWRLPPAAVDGSGQPQVQRVPTDGSGQPQTQRAPTDAPGQPQTQRLPTDGPGQPQTQRAPTDGPGQPQTQRLPTDAAGQPQVQRVPTDAPGQPETARTHAAPEPAQTRTRAERERHSGSARAQPAASDDGLAFGQLDDLASSWGSLAIAAVGLLVLTIPALALLQHLREQWLGRPKPTGERRRRLVRG